MTRLDHRDFAEMEVTRALAARRPVPSDDEMRGHLAKSIGTCCKQVEGDGTCIHDRARNGATRPPLTEADVEAALRAVPTITGKDTGLPYADIPAMARAVLALLELRRK